MIINNKLTTFLNSIKGSYQSFKIKCQIKYSVEHQVVVISIQLIKQIKNNTKILSCNIDLPHNRIQ